MQKQQLLLIIKVVCLVVKCIRKKIFIEIKFKRFSCVVFYIIIVSIEAQKPQVGFFVNLWGRIKGFIWKKKNIRPALPLISEEEILHLRLKVSKFASLYLIIDVEKF